jgi:glycosyltransferase involved in cell wall biosynthesis
MKAAIYNPYLDTLGGGERYTLSFVKALIDKRYQVDIEWKSKGIVKLLEDRFGMNLVGVNVVENVNRGDGYDLCFWVSDGSIPALRARKNLLHFQIPLHDVNGKSLMNKMKLFRVSKVICNSFFTKKIIDREYGVNSVVIYPPIDTKSIKPKRKENIILYVGRFSKLTQSKRQDVLVHAFKKLISAGGLSDWKLILVGGIEVGVDSYFEEIKKISSELPIEIITSPDFKTLKELYGRAKLFWSASGFGEDEAKNPQKVEHFGMTVVEAMTAGVVPVVYNAGGHKEIIRDSKNGFLWTKENDLIKITSKIIKDKSLLRRISANAKSDSEFYSKEKFEEEIFKLI